MGVLWFFRGSPEDPKVPEGVRLDYQTELMP